MGLSQRRPLCQLSCHRLKKRTHIDEFCGFQSHRSRACHPHRGRGLLAKPTRGHQTSILTAEVVTCTVQGSRKTQTGDQKQQSGMGRLAIPCCRAQSRLCLVSLMTNSSPWGHCYEEPAKSRHCGSVSASEQKKPAQQRTAHGKNTHRHTDEQQCGLSQRNAQIAPSIVSVAQCFACQASAHLQLGISCGEGCTAF